MTTTLCYQDFAKRSHVSDGVLRPGSRRLRLGLLAFIALAWGALLVTRMYSLQVADFATWQDWALKQHFADVELASERGPIYDRNNRLLAVSVPAGSVYVRPALVRDKPSAAQLLSKVLGMDRKAVALKLNQDKPFVWIKRQLPREQAERVEALNIQGVGYMLESRRFYPYNQAASTLIGKVGIDGHGLSGLEEQYERHLRGAEVTARFTRDALGKMIEAPADVPLNTELPRGSEMHLTIDANLQMIVDEELAAGKANANAKSAMAALVDATTGEVLAISQAPALNYNVSAIKSKAEMTNKIAETVFEPGSIMKPLVAAAALQEHVVTPNEIINCENGRYSFGKHIIKDVHPSASIPFRDVIVRSSNIGMTKVGARLGKEKLYQYLRAMGFGSATGVGLPGESGGILRPVENWAIVDVATHSFGQGVAVTPLQMLRAMSAIANGGYLPSLRVLQDQPVAPPQRIYSASVADKVKDMLYAVVEDEHGTGGKALIEGIRVGGKTGTAQKANPNGRGYLPGAYMSSFIGFVDGTSLGVPQKLTLMVVIDEPNTTSIYGGTLAAPVFNRIMKRALNHLTTQRELGEGPGVRQDSDHVIDPKMFVPKLNPGFTQVSFVPTE